MNEVIEEKLSYQAIKEIIKGKLNSVAESFVAIGYRLKQVRDGQLYKEDGYKDIYEFAKQEYNLSISNVSRFMAINDKFSINGNSPYLIPEYEGYGSSKLSEMLNLDEEELKLVSEKTTVKEIREIKQLKNEGEKNNTFATSQKTEESIDFTQSEPDFQQIENQDISNLKNIVPELFKDKERRNHLKELSALLHKNLSENDLAQEISELINPSKHFMFKKGFNIVIFEENVIKYKEFGGPTIEYNYLDFLEAARDVFDMAAGDPWTTYYGEPEPEETEQVEEPKAKSKESKTDKDKRKKPEPEKQPKQQEKKADSKNQSGNQEETSNEDEIPGQANINDYPEYAPDNEKVEKVEGEVIHNSIEESSQVEQVQEVKKEEDNSKIHDLKIDHVFFADVLREIKTFELLKNDRDYQVGDILRLQEYIDEKPTGRKTDREVTFLLQNYPGLQDGYCILGIRPV